MIESLRRGRDHIFPVCKIHGKSEERFAREARRTVGRWLANPRCSCVVTADGADSAVCWQGIHNAAFEHLVGVPLAGSYVDPVRVISVDGDGTTSQAGTGKISRIHVERIHQGTPRHTPIHRAEHPSVGRRCVNDLSSWRNSYARNTTADGGIPKCL